jgi:putative aminopeptidase FrvX
MDEVGFMISIDDGEGLFQFIPVGSVDVRQIVGKPVLIGKDKVPGVIGARAIHLTTAEERRHTIPLDTLRIDVGLGETKGKVAPGDRVAFATRFTQNEYSLMGKALDDRLGVATLIELLKNPPDQVELQVVFTTQEEIGGRGAEVAAYALNPDVAIVVDSTPARDLPSWDGSTNTQFNCKLDEGPAIYTMDKATLSDPRLISHLISTAEKEGIPFQMRQPGSGGTDAGAIHRQRAGIPSVSMSVPGRNAHTPILVARKADWLNTMRLLNAAVAGLDRSILER